MADVKWIKIVTDVFDNRKIKLIRKMPEGDSIVVTWFQLLCLAGETNDNGLIYITKALPYTEETLASAFDSTIAVIRLALQTFESLEMVTICNNFYCVANWEKYQNTDGLTRIKEQTRARVAKHRQKQKEVSECNVTVTLPVTHCNATELELELEQELDIDNTPLPPKGDGAFDRFWAVYPRKIGKGAARKAFAKAKVDISTLLAAVETQKRSDQWTRDGGQYIPHPATWLNQGRWEDEVDAPPERPAPKRRKHHIETIDGVEVLVWDD